MPQTSVLETPGAANCRFGHNGSSKKTSDVVAQFETDAPDGLDVAVGAGGTQLGAEVADCLLYTSNPIDAESRGIQNGDTLRVFNDRGEVQIMARVTSRIMPGVVGMPHAHRREIVDGVDIGANANTLSGHHWSPISKNCPSTGSTLVQVEKA